MILRAAKRNSVDLRRSILLRDKAMDGGTGRVSGVACCVLVKAG